MRAARAIIGAALLCFTACSSTTKLITEPPGARVYVNGDPVGETPYEYSDMAVIGTSLVIRLEKPGYEPLTAVIPRSEELDPIACGAGACLCPVVFLWVMRYRSEHHYILKPSAGFPEMLPQPN